MAPRNKTEDPPAEAISNGHEGNHAGLSSLLWHHGTIVPKTVKQLMVAVLGKL